MDKLLKRNPVLKNISTVIFKQNRTLPYLNAITGKTGKKIDDIVANGEKYILLSNEGKTCTSGFYAEYDKEEDALLVYAMRFDCNLKKWKITGRTVISRKENEIKALGYDAFCELSDITSYRLKGTVIPGHATEVIRQFFGGFFMDWKFNVSNLITSDNYIEAFRSRDILFQKSLKKNINIDKNWEIKALPAEAKRRMYMLFAKKIRKNYIDRAFINNGIEFIYLQKADGGYIARHFGCCIKSVDIQEPSKFTLDFFEIMRLGITDVKTALDYTSGNMLMASLLYYDREGIEDGCFKYFGPLLKNLANKAKKACENPDNNGSYFSNYHMPEMLTYMNCPLWEKIYNSDYERLKEHFENCINNTFSLNGKSPSFRHKDAVDFLESNIENIFGHIYWDKKPLHQMLGIPLHMLKTIGTAPEIKPCTLISDLKSIFSSHPDYLRGMNKQSVNSLFICLKRNFKKRVKMNPKIKACIENLVKVYGPENVEAYINFCAKHKDIVTYYNYTRYLCRLGEIGRKMEWKLIGSELNKQNEFAGELSAMFCYEKDYETYKEKYRKREAELKKYSYERNGLIITYPKTPEDVIKEGLILHHCAKSFARAVGDGTSTLLFIRKKSNPEKPFYTLELKENRVRQCHGMCNKNITENHNVEIFLKNFCNEFHITYCTGTELLGI